MCKYEYFNFLVLVQNFRFFGSRENSCRTKIIIDAIQKKVQNAKLSFKMKYSYYRYLYVANCVLKSSQSLGCCTYSSLIRFQDISVGMITNTEKDNGVKR